MSIRQKISAANTYCKPSDLKFINYYTTVQHRAVVVVVVVAVAAVSVAYDRTDSTSTGRASLDERAYDSGRWHRCGRGHIFVFSRRGGGRSVSFPPPPPLLHRPPAASGSALGTNNNNNKCLYDHDHVITCPAAAVPSTSAAEQRLASADQCVTGRRRCRLLLLFLVIPFVKTT